MLGEEAAVGQQQCSGILREGRIEHTEAYNGLRLKARGLTASWWCAVMATAMVRACGTVGRRCIASLHAARCPSLSLRDLCFPNELSEFITNSSTSLYRNRT
jgi:hypothetical protein